MNEITESANISSAEFNSEINYFKSIDHIEEVSGHDRRYFYIIPQGIVAYYNQPHILEGKNERKIGL